ncbi:MAG: hypothetical protein FKY71_04575 [Spiribacter salinus]|uniref:Acetoacetate decarboxylase n=1 Tax=Spiribacter salinus TaxID=1335746 RepID=A0A540VTV2_9GAMM|nr:MAG: hypothetical protein FKY71_04575 [Spiribacter salinus]
MTWPYSTPHACPLYAELPYAYRGVRKVSVFCRCDAEALDRFLPPELERVSDVCEIFVMRAPDAGPLGSYDEAGLVIPVCYGDTVGAHVSLEYVTTDDSLCAGREIWGYPKKLATVDFEESADHQVDACVSRRDQSLIRVRFTPSGGEFEKPAMQPRLQIKTFARADGQGHDFYQVVHNQVQDINLRERYPGKADLELDGNDQDPLHRLSVQEVIGAELTVFDFLLTDGSIIAELSTGTSQNQ